jgi:peptidoglycan-associated lipoprotein
VKHFTNLNGGTAMKKTKTRLVISLVALLMLFAGCKKNATMPVEVVEEPAPQPVVEEVKPKEPDPVWSPVDLEAELARLIKENLQVLYFALDKYDLTSESLQKLQIAANFLKQQPQLRVRLDGHADERGTTEYNMALGEKRARAAFDVLVRHGVARDRMETTSFGRERPVNSHCMGDEACHSLNRRVEYTVIKK